MALPEPVTGERFAMPSLGEIWNQFKLLEPLGQGGMGQVFLAQDTTLDRKVALKFLPDRLEKDKRARTRFLREAKSAAALDHPYICKIYEIGEAEGRAFIAMEYIEGMTLAQKLAAGAMRIPDILDLGTEMGEAVDAAHKKGIVHRDLKPANIMVSGRDTTRAALGMAWLFQRFRGTCPFSHHHSSRFRKPPSHPGRSDFPSPVGSSSFPQRTFPGLPRFKHSPAYTPWRQGYTSSSTPLEISTANLALSPDGAPVRCPPLTESPFARRECYSERGEVNPA